MAKMLVVFEYKYGNTKRVTGKIIEGFNEIGIDVSLKELTEVDFKNIS